MPNKFNHNRRLIFGLTMKKAVKIKMMEKSKSVKTDTIVITVNTVLILSS